ncbi:NAD(P)-dependent oxidoreductase [soil metagenome]
MIGFIGLGAMGRSMAANLQRKIGAVTVWNRTASKADGLLGLGASIAATPAELARVCDIICVCVSDTPDVEQVIFGPDGVAEGLKPGALIVDFSTISAEASERFAERVAAKGARWLDAPVTGGDIGARDGTLTIMVGGAEEDFDRAQNVFDAVGKKAVFMGPTGSGQRTKLANQIAAAGAIVALAESFNYAREQGMDVQRVFDVISSGAAGSWSMSNYGPRILRGDMNPGFAAALMAKDMRLVLQSLEGTESDYSVVRKMAEVYEQMVANGDGRLGNHAAAKYLGWK